MTDVLRIEGVTKSYGGIHAVCDVSLTVRAGEVHALCGENGAGKSTVIEVLAGGVLPEAGVVTVSGDQLQLGSPKSSLDMGIRVIHQDLHLAPDLSILDNVFLGKPATTYGGLLDYQAMTAETTDLLHRVGAGGLSPRQRVASLRAGERQMVAIAKALNGDARLLVMDEPTASLTEGEKERLLELVGRLKAQGLGIIFVSHHLAEVFRISDRVSVLRDGVLVQTRNARETTPSEVTEAMIGRPLQTSRPPEVETGLDSHTAEILSVTEASGDGFENVSFSVRAGKCVALVGLVGSGRTEILRAVSGVDRLTGGTVSLHGQVVATRKKSRIPAGSVAFVPESRKTEGLLTGLSVRENVSISSLRRLRRWGLLTRRQETAVVKEWCGKLRVKTATFDVPVNQLSGGNQQKVILARWMAADADLFLLDEPTHGVDVGAKEEIRRHITDLKTRGKSVVLVSSDMEEVHELSDEVCFLHRGRLRKKIPTRSLTHAEMVHHLLTPDNGSSDDPGQSISNSVNGGK